MWLLLRDTGHALLTPHLFVDLAWECLEVPRHISTLVGSLGSLPEPNSVPSEDSMSRATTSTGMLDALLILLCFQVYNLLPVKDLRGYSYQNHYLNEQITEQCMIPKNIIVDGIHYTPVPHGRGDPYELLKVSTKETFSTFELFLTWRSWLPKCLPLCPAKVHRRGKY